MYEPEVNDYVEWTTQLGQVHEGWVYFKASPVIQKRGWPKQTRYLTIEVGVKEKPDIRRIIRISMYIYFFVVMSINGKN